ncbi:MAG: distal tail protein Dit, partial [Paraclostridium sp.]
TLKDIARDMKRWLQSEPSFDKLFLSDDLDNYYEAICLNKLDIARVAINFAELLIIFECNPILKSIEGNAPIIINENNRSIYNKGLKSYPYFKIYGTGDVTININEQQLILKSIEEYIEVDSEIYNCFKDNINLNNKMYSDFPLFYPGTNNISWSGDISKIEIIPRWGDV